MLLTYTIILFIDFFHCLSIITKYWLIIDSALYCSVHVQKWTTETTVWEIWKLSLDYLFLKKLSWSFQLYWWPWYKDVLDLRIEKQVLGVARTFRIKGIESQICKNNSYYVLRFDSHIYTWSIDYFKILQNNWLIY